MAHSSDVTWDYKKVKMQYVCFRELFKYFKFNYISNQITSLKCILLSDACLTVMQKSLQASFLAYLYSDILYKIFMLVYIHFVTIRA